MVNGDDLPFLEKLVYGISAILAWIGVKSYTVGGTVSDFKGELKNLKERLDGREEQCPKLQEAMFERLSNMVYISIDKNINAVVLEQTKVLAEMNQRLALIAQSHKDLSRKVSELGQQKIIIANPHDTGHRRRTTDPQEERDGFQ